MHLRFDLREAPLNLLRHLKSLKEEKSSGYGSHKNRFAITTYFVRPVNAGFISRLILCGMTQTKYFYKTLKMKLKELSEPSSNQMFHL